MVAPDKFRGTASARQAASAMAKVLKSVGYEVIEVPMSDGGEGFADVVGGNYRRTRVTSSTGQQIEARYKMLGDTAVIEMASAAGLSLLDAEIKNDPINSTTRGVGELIRDAAFHGSKRVIVGCGGSATTDGGLGAIQALEPIVRLRGIDLVAAADVRTLFMDAAKEFAPQKGATPAQVMLLSARLESLKQRYITQFGVDVSRIQGGGAAGGLAGGLAAIGAKIESGFDITAELSGFFEVAENADLIVTGEGFLDAHSYEGKVVGGVEEFANSSGIPYLVIAGDMEESEIPDRVDRGRIRTLVEAVGEKAAYESTTNAIERALLDLLSVKN